MIKVLKTGFYDTIQDLGRFGQQEFGISISGVMDAYSARLANQILGNNKNDAVLEMTMTGPRLQIETDTSICIVGATISPNLNALSISQNKSIPVKNGDILSFGKLDQGFRTYLAVTNGFQTDLVFGSRSMFSNITKSQRINDGDELPIGQQSRIPNDKNATVKFNLKHFDNQKIDVFEGPEFEQLTQEQKKQLFAKDFTISKDNSRMAYQLVEPFKNRLTPIITSSVLPGTIQLTPSGKLIILMRDCQVTGGYPRILQLSNKAISRLSQGRTNDIISFNLID